MSSQVRAEPPAGVDPQAGRGRLRHRRPARDAHACSGAWLDDYGPSFVGLTGSLGQIGEIEHKAGVPTAILQKSKGVASYQVEHSSILFVYSPDDLLARRLRLRFQTGDYAHDLPLLLKFR